MSKNESSQSGFALLVVIWGLALIAVLAVAVTSSARHRVISASATVERAKADALADAGITIGRFQILNRRGADQVNSPAAADTVICEMPGAAVAVISIEDEGGKVDLNSAPRPLIEALLIGVGAKQSEAETAAAAISSFSRLQVNAQEAAAIAADYTSAGRSFTPKNAPFETTLELDQVLELRYDLFRRILPYVTVHSRVAGFDSQVAPRGLIDALRGNLPAEFMTVSARRAFLIHAEVMTPAGGHSVRQSIVELAGIETPLVVREWRRGESRHESMLRDALSSLSQRTRGSCDKT